MNASLTTDAQADEALAMGLLMSVGEPSLVARVRDASERQGVTVTQFIANALKRCGGVAGGSWAAAADTLLQSGAPGIAALGYLLEVALAHNEDTSSRVSIGGVCVQ